MQLKRWILGALLALALLAGAGARPAQACGGGYGAGGLIVLGLAGGALAVGGADVVFTIGDAVMAGNHRTPPVAWGVGELLLAAPQAGLFGYWTYTTLRDHREDATLPMALTLWTTGLAAHGIYAIVRGQYTPDTDEPPRRHAAVDWKVAPAMVSSGQARAAPGAVLFGRF